MSSEGLEMLKHLSMGFVAVVKLTGVGRVRTAEILAGLGAEKKPTPS